LLLLCLGCDGYTHVAGTIRDTSGAPVPGALVVFTPKGSHYPKQTSSGPDGAYSLGSTHGWWNVRLDLVVSKEGYRTVETEFKATRQHTRRMDIVLSSVEPHGDAGTQKLNDTDRLATGSGFGSFTLPGGSKFVTMLYDLKVVGKLRTSKKLPYYILSGVGCNGCDANKSIYIHSPTDGPMKNEGEQPRFPYPGRETDYQSGQVVSDTRMLYGNCLSTHPNAVVWFYRTFGDDKKWHDGVLVAEVKEDRLATTELNRQLPKPEDAEMALRVGECYELPGIASYSEP
jgi:Carboxypeptidase regulatory-like domain